MSSPVFIEQHHPDPQQLAAEAVRGLLAQPAVLSPKFLYDALGSRLFDAITELDEYYPTRTEAAIVAQALPELAQRLGKGMTLVDLGAGSCAKAARLFGALQPHRYVAVDISVAFLRQSLGHLQREYPQVEMVGVGQDFSSELSLPPHLCAGPVLVFYPGSSIGNFAPEAALRLLRQARALAPGASLLIGVDLVKPTSVLEAAYDDPLGVTAAFNLNLLRHLNGLLGTDFDIRSWQHVALFNVAASRIEMHLQARQEQTVRWPGGVRRFTAGERIHTENSYKWTVAGFSTLLREAGYAQVQPWTDARDWFALLLASG